MSRDCASSTSRERVQIAIAVVARGGKYLIGLRLSGSDLAGQWEFPGGKIEPGETPEDAAPRECREETGLSVRVIGTLGSKEHDYQHAAVCLHFFACEITGEQGPLPARFRWVEASELGKYSCPAANTQIIELLMASAQTGVWKLDLERLRDIG